MINALEAALLAQRAYSEMPTFGKNDSAARAVQFDAVTVGFPGSDNIACWLADLDAIAEDVPGMGRMHSGFWRTYLEISEPLLAIPEVDVILGHSLGGALALIYAAQRCLAGKPPKAVFAFEPPRISADKTIGAILRAHKVQCLLTQNGNDVVPMVPRLFESWQHPAQITPIGEPSIRLPNIEDHLIGNVILALKGTN